jgi:hypothetical protein
MVFVLVNDRLTEGGDYVFFLFENKLLLPDIIENLLSKIRATFQISLYTSLQQCFVKLLEFQWERIVLLSLLICFYTVTNLNLWPNSKTNCLKTHLLVYSTTTEDI